MEIKLTHHLYHLRDNKGNVLGILSGESGELFMRYFKEYSSQMFLKYPSCIRKDLPEQFAVNHLVGSFAEAVRWWIQTKMKDSPEILADYYLKVIGYKTRN